jgi:hypothetical protein
MDSRTVLLVVVTAATIVASVAGATAPNADDIAKVILESLDAQHANSRLVEMDSSLVDRSWALKPLLDRVVAGTDTPEHLNAVCHSDAWSDGGWWAEIQGASFDAVAAAPERFARRYVEGSDCALLVLVYGLKWTYANLEVLYGCEDDLDPTFRELDAAIEHIQDGVSSIVSLRHANPRHRILFETVTDLVSLSRSQRAKFRIWCEEQPAAEVSGTPSN